MGRGSRRSRRGREGPAPTPCVQAECFDPLVRHCVACRLLRTAEPGRGARGEEAPGRARAPRPPRPAAPPLPPPASPPTAARAPSGAPPPAAASSPAPGTALQPLESVGAGAGAEAALPLPGLLFGAPALLGLALALALLALVSWRWRRQRGTASPEAPDGGQEEPLDSVFVPSSGTLDASAPGWPPLREDASISPPGHSVPVPATELGSTELVTTKTAGPEPQ